MQAATRPPSSGLSSQSRRIAIFAILLFGLSGLISGFAMGAFIRPKIPGVTTSRNGITPPVSQSTSTTTSPGSKNLSVAEPKLTAFTYIEIANGATQYTASTVIRDENTNKPIQNTDVTCKLWLAKDFEQSNDLLKVNNYAILTDVGNLQQPFSTEEQNALHFIAPSQQTKACTPQGNTSWTYTLSSSVKSGSYYLFVVDDWKGRHFNWWAQAIRIKGGGD
jgi:hypothetical protein